MSALICNTCEIKWTRELRYERERLHEWYGEKVKNEMIQRERKNESENKKERERERERVWESEKNM